MRSPRLPCSIAVISRMDITTSWSKIICYKERDLARKFYLRAIDRFIFLVWAETQIVSTHKETPFGGTTAIGLMHFNAIVYIIV